MFGPGTHHHVAVQLIQRVITQGRRLMCDKGTVVGYKNDDGEVIGFATYKGKSEGDVVGMMDILYEGIKSDAAASRYVDIVGPLAAIGDAVKFFRAEQNKNVVIDV